MLRWISADSVLAQPYDPPSLNKYAYVRNDPVNWIDPDGKMAAPLEIKWLSPVMLTFWSFMHDDEGYINGLTAISSIVFKDTPSGALDPTALLAARLADRQSLARDLEYRAGVGNDQKGHCFDFLLNLIGQLKGRVTEGFSIGTLIGHVMSSYNKNPDPTLTANARTVGNTITLRSTPIDPMGNDYISTLLDEGFHLLKTVIPGTGKIDDLELANAISLALPTKYQEGTDPSTYNKQMFGEQCGPK